jgi:hypothetical protein
MLKNIFQIAICHGDLTLPDQKKNDHIKNKKIYFDSSDSEEELISKIKSPELVVVMNHPNEKELLQAFKEQINSLKIITFHLLSRIEQRLCEKFQVIHFYELGYGNFMNYIQQNEQLLFSIDTKFNFISSESNENHSKILIPFEDLEQFILQTLDRSIDQQYIEQIICYHFHIESFEQLGYGSYHSILNTIKQNKKTKNTSIHYECIMFDEIPLLKQKLKSSFEGRGNYFKNIYSINYLFRI